ncbi:unnamed protein product [Tenebrio molitor]|nr:unnamed protein product [Tenebrio molitor]
MAARIAFVFLAALLVFQALTWESHATAIRRDVSSSNASQTVDEAMQSFKSSLDDIVKNIQVSPRDFLSPPKDSPGDSRRE